MRALTVSLTSLALAFLGVGIAVYGVRVWLHRPDVRPSAHTIRSLPRPVAAASSIVDAHRTPRDVEGFRLVSIVPASKGHDLHALYEKGRHISLFLRPIAPYKGPSHASNYGLYWTSSAPLGGHPCFVRAKSHGRAALAWVARGRRHVVTGDVSLAELRSFAAAYEQAVRR